MTGDKHSWSELLDLYVKLGCPEIIAPPPGDEQEEEACIQIDADGNLEPTLPPPPAVKVDCCPADLCDLLRAMRSIDGYAAYKGTLQRSFQLVPIAGIGIPQQILPADPNRRSITINSVNRANFQVWWVGYGDPVSDPSWSYNDNSPTFALGPSQNTTWIVEGVIVKSVAANDTLAVYQETYVEEPC